ncbi:MAG: metallophosphoesterase, partial [Xanthomonadaceae bacterium]|nr:metallophosphoesterase [Xanthomonadaceae bacterium]
MRKRLRILHLSDLHIGKEQTEDAWRLQRVMGDAWARNLREVAADGAIDLVCFTGDLAQSGKPQQYLQIRRIVESVVASAKVAPDRFFCVPGNHDIDRSLSLEAWTKLRDLQWHHPQALSAWMVGGKTPFGCEDIWRDCIVCRQQAYRDFLIEAGLSHLLPGQAGNPHPRLGYRRTLDLGLGAPLHIIGFDSAWLAGDHADAGKLRLTEDQIGRLMTDNGFPLPGWSIGLIHHPLTDLADGRDAQRLLGHYGLGLLLHGHQHEPVIERWADPQTGLHVFAAGCLYEHERYPNGLLVVDVELPEAQPLRPQQVWARKWSHRRSEWSDDDDLYRGARNGRLSLVAEYVEPFVATPGKFFGREDELTQLRTALLPDGRNSPSQPALICCAIDGMPGVGKTRLAERFVSEHWLAAYPPPADIPIGKCVLRLMLATGEDQAVVRSADDLLRDLAGRLGLKGSLDDHRRDVPSEMRHGPGGHPRLVLIENVDSEAQAAEVAALVHGLPGCPILITARVRKFGGQAWTRVQVAPLPLAEAVDLLLNEAAGFGEDAWAPRDRNDLIQAQILAEKLGRLPLALHIAASHLGLGKTPDEFLSELRAAGLDLEPAQPGDHGLQVDRARAILRTSFDLSWATWCRGKGANPEWQQALVALAHGPAEGVGESLGAAIAALPPAQYGPCLVAAGRLSLLDWTWADEGETRERRARLHALIAEFLRLMPTPDAATVLARMSGWFVPLLSEDDEHRIGPARRGVHRENDALVHWLLRTTRPLPLRMMGARDYALAVGPFAAWQSCFERWWRECTDTQDRMTLGLMLSDVARSVGEPENALHWGQQVVEDATLGGLDRELALAQGQIADILQARGELEEALRIRREEELPVYERLGDVRSRAITQGKIADILQARGELEEALRIRREDQMPVYERLGDVRSRAITQGKIADILQARGELEEALRIRREEELPVYERLGDVRSRAITQGQIADILQARGELEEALRIRREEELPVYERLGDVRSRAITQ